MIEVPFVTKLLPPRSKLGLISRPVLTARLRQGMDLRLQVLSCGAGYGKTTLLAELARSLEVPTCWYSLEPSDADPQICLTYLLAAFQRALPAISDRLEQLAGSSQGSSGTTGAILGRLVGLLHDSGAKRVVLLLDDFHALEGTPAAKEAILPLIERAPAMLHVILATRTQPRFAGFSRMLVHQEASVLREADFRLSVEEIELLHRTLLGTGCQREDADALAVASEGWPAGVVLMLQAGGVAAPQQIVAPGEELFGYLAAEVLEQQPAGLRDFMLRTSILVELTPDLCKMLTQRPDTQAVLEEMERRNAFLTRTSAQTFRYHQLFRTFLQQVLQREDPALFMKLNLEVARHFQEQGKLALAAEHYGYAGEPSLAAQALLSIGDRLFDLGQWHTLARLIDALPRETLDLHPQLLVIRGKVASRQGEALNALDFLARAISHFEKEGSGLDLTQALMARSITWRFQGAHDRAVKDARRALRLAEDLKGPSKFLASAHRQVGMAYAHAGSFLRARRHFLQALKLLKDADGESELGLTQGFLGALYLELGDLSKAAIHYTRACQVWRQLGNPSELAETLNNMAVLLHTQGHFREAQRTAAEAVQLARKSGYLRVEATALLTEGDAVLGLGAYEQALDCYQQGLVQAGLASEAQAIAYGTAALGECYRLMGQHQLSAGLLSRAVADAEARKQPYELGLYRSCLGSLALSEGQVDRAQEELQKACQILRQTGHRRATALAHFHLAHTRFLMRRHADALLELNEVGAICTSLGSSAFLLPQARHAQDLLHYAVMRGAGLAIAELARAILPQGPAQTSLAASTTKDIQVEAFALDAGLVRINGKDIQEKAWEGAKARELLFFLLCAERPPRKEELIAALWPDKNTETGTGALHTAMHRLRGALLPEAVLFDNGTYKLNPDWDWWFDYKAFTKLVKEAATWPTGSDERVERLQAAVELYKAPLLHWCYNDWCESLRRGAEEQCSHAHLSIARRDMGRGEWRAAIAHLQRARLLEPLEEAAVRDLMHCHAGLRDFEAVVGTYEEYRRVLRDELGVEPSKGLQSLLQKLSSGDLPLPSPKPYPS